MSITSHCCSEGGRCWLTCLPDSTSLHTSSELFYVVLSVTDRLWCGSLPRKVHAHLKSFIVGIPFQHTRRMMEKGGSERSSIGSESPGVSISKPNHMRDTINGQRATIAKLFEQGKFLLLPPLALVEKNSPKFPRLPGWKCITGRKKNPTKCCL